MAQAGSGAVGVMGRVLLVIGAIVVVLGGGAWWWVSAWQEEQRTRERERQKDEDAIQATATVSTSCPKETPILVGVKNRSSRVLKSFSFRIATYRTGNSEDLAEGEMHLTWTNIVRPGATYSQCVWVTDRARGVGPLVLRVEKYLVTFYEPGEFIP